MIVLCAITTLGGPALGQDRSFPINPGQVIERGVRYVSETGDHYMIFQPDRTLVIYRMDGGFVWAMSDEPGVEFFRADRVRMNLNGNFRVVDDAGKRVWSALTDDPDPSAQLVLSETGALQLVSPTRGTFWATDGVLALAGPSEVISFQSPSGNIHCFGTEQSVRCDIITVNVRSFSQRPNS